MGNLLGSPVTEKETHEGVTPEGIQFGVSSMQGWRVHMEDAHILEPHLYAAEPISQADIFSNNNNDDVAVEDALELSSNNAKKRFKKLELPGHALFGVFDGHGGTFAAAYAGRNLLRVLSRQPKFVEYAKFVQQRASREAQLQGSSAQRVQFVRSGLELLEGALCDAFVDLDKEIGRATRNLPNFDADAPYHGGYDTIVADNGDIIMVENENCSAMTEHSAHADSAANANSSSNFKSASKSAAAAVTAATRPVAGAAADESDSGTTACVVLVTPDWIVCANAGDSRAVFSKHGHKVVPLSYDHKPDDEEEERRIRAAGGYVAAGRVEGDLAVSRGLGDFRFKNMDTVLQGTMFVSKQEGPGAEGHTRGTSYPRSTPHEDQKVTAIPDVIVQNRSKDQDEFIIVACDGIWDVQSNYEGIKTIADIFDEGEKRAALACEELCDLCLKLGSKDNMTTLIIRFPAQQSGQGGGVLARRQQRDEPSSGKDEAGASTSTT